MKNKIFCLLFAFILCLIDLLIKFFIKANIKGKSLIKIFNGFIQILYVENKGAAFGIFDESRWLLIFISFIFILCLLLAVLSKKGRNNIFLISLALTIGGGLGNLVDRLLNGYVVDYIKLPFFPPVFNFADCLLTLGISGLIINIMFIQKDEKL